MSKKTFLKGAAILGIAGLIVQVLGAVFRIPLANIIGDEGMGYYGGGVAMLGHVFFGCVTHQRPAVDILHPV